MKTRENISEKIFAILCDLVDDAVVIFSRDSISRKMMLLDPAYKEWQLNRSFQYVVSKGYVKRNASGYKVTERGMKRIDYYKIKRLGFKGDLRGWDHQWRIIIFDVPETERDRRDLLRDKLFDWDCTKLQQSVFVTPYACDNEIDRLVGLLNLNKHVYVMVVSTLGEVLTSRMKKIYKL